MAASDVDGDGVIEILIGGKTGADMFRIKIWNKATEEEVYDNIADTMLGRGSMVIHK